MTRRQGLALASRWIAEAGMAWAALAILVFYVDPGQLPRPVALILLLGPLFGCLASPALLWAMWHDPSVLWWYRRWSYRCAGSLCVLCILHALQQLTVLRMLLIGLVAGGLLLLRWRTRRAAATPALVLPDAAPEPAAALAAPSRPTVPPVSPAPRLVQRIGRGSR